MKLALLIAASCPVGSNVAVYAHLHHKDYPYAVETVVISTLFSIVSIPAIVWLAGLIW
jgi:predicted permease